MIRLLVRLPLGLAVLLSVLWAATLLGRVDTRELLTGGLSDLEEALPEKGGREAVVEEARRLTGGAATLLSRVGVEASPVLRSTLFVSGLHLGATLRVLPFLGLLLAVGALAGVVLRERLRDGSGYASPTVGYLARGLVALALTWLVLFALSPVRAPYGSLYAATMSSCIGSLLYAANLPLKL